MTRTDMAMAKLAERLNLSPEAATHLPVSVATYAERLKMTPIELVEICPLAPALMTTIARECRENAQG